MIGWPWGSGQAPTSQWAATYYVSLALVVLFVRSQEVTGEVGTQLPETNVAGVAGAPGKLPCVVTHNTMGGAPVLVLWYKDGARLPFYTLDLREGEGEKREVFVDKTMQGRVHADEPGSYLTLDNLQGQDSGRYKCRVDFENSPTLSALVNLTVYVVPSRLQVLDSNNMPVSAGFYGPLVEGSPLTLYCVATGGWPTPQVSWWKGNLLLANHSVVIGDDNDYLHHEVMNGGMMSPSAGMRQVKTKLMIPKIPRDFVHANLTCQVSNNNITEPLSTTLSLDVLLRPSSVKIKSSGSPLVEGRQARIECVAVGAYPSAELSWEKVQLGEKTKLHASSRNLGDQTSSYLVIMPEAEDHGATLTCTARNPKIQNAELSTSTRLQVHFAPRVSLKLGATLGTEPITEGKDVYFECDVASNPEQHKTIWHHNGEKVEHQLKAGILVSSSNLVLQMVRRTSAGNYTCTAVNSLGATKSNVVPLHIRYLPVCVDTPQTVAVAEGEDVRLTCRVDAQPENDLEFTWYFNNTLDTVEVERHRVQVRAGHSFLDYTPRSARDYGTLSCWAHNTVGTQADPCRFTVVEAGPPDSVANCKLVNLTVETLEVECSPGSDGGLPQRFEARVFASPTNALVTTMVEDAPRFHVGGLTPGQDYVITVTAVNDKGPSKPQEIDAVRLKVAEKRMGDVSAPPVPPLVVVFLGLVGGFVLLLLLGILLTRVRSNRCSCLRHEGRGDTNAGGIVSATGTPTNTTTKSSSSAHATAHTRPAHTLREEEEEEAPDVLRTVNAAHEGGSAAGARGRGRPIPGSWKPTTPTARRELCVAVGGQCSFLPHSDAQPGSCT